MPLWPRCLISLHAFSVNAIVYGVVIILLFMFHRCRHNRTLTTTLTDAASVKAARSRSSSVSRRFWQPAFLFICSCLSPNHSVLDSRYTLLCHRIASLLKSGACKASPQASTEAQSNAQLILCVSNKEKVRMRTIHVLLQIFTMSVYGCIL